MSYWLCRKSIGKCFSPRACCLYTHVFLAAEVGFLNTNFLAKSPPCGHGIRTQWCTSQKHIHSTRRNLENISQYLPQSSIQMAKYILISTLALCMGAFLAAAMPVHHMERRQDARQNLLQQFHNEYQNNFSEPESDLEDKAYYICNMTSLMKIGSHLQCSVCTCKHWFSWVYYIFSFSEYYCYTCQPQRENKHCEHLSKVGGRTGYFEQGNHGNTTIFQCSEYFGSFFYRIKQQRILSIAVKITTGQSIPFHHKNHVSPQLITYPP